MTDKGRWTQIKVLLVDDDPDFLRQGKEFIKEEDDRLDISTSTSVSEALDLLEENDYDAVVSDYKMPEMNGLEFLKYLREEKGSDIPFIILTGKGREEVAMEALNSGANRYLKKGGDVRMQFEVLANSIVEEIERREAKKIIERERKKSQEYLNIAEVIILVLDRNQRVTLINEKGCEILGYEKEEIIGKNWIENFVPKRWRDRVRGTFETLMSGEVKRARTGENPVLTKSGEERIILWRNTVRRDESGEIIGTLSSGSDITERTERKKKLRRATQAIGNSRDAILSLNKEGKITYCNDAVEKIFGYSEEELRGESLKKLWPEEEDFSESWETFIEDREGGGGEQMFEVQGERKDGSTFPAEVSLSAYEEDDNLIFTGVIRDVSERKKAQEKLRESEEKYRKLTEFSPNAIILIDADTGKIKDVNRHALKLLDMPKEKIVDMHHAELYPEEDSERYRDLFETYVPGRGEIRKMSMGRENLYLINSSGEKIPVELHSSTFEIGDKKFVQDIYTEIAERKEMEEKYRIVSEGSSNGIYVFQDGKFKFVNDSLVEMFGYSREELKEMDFLELAHPDYREEIEEWTEQALTGDTSRLPSKHEFKALRKDGSSIWVQLTPSLVEYQGKPAIVGNISDITERKRIEEQLRENKKRLEKMFEASEDGIVVINPEGEVIEANESAAHIVRAKNKEELIGQNAFEFVHPEDQEAAEEMVRKTYEDEKIQGKREFRVLTKEGETIHTSASASILYDDSGNPFGTINIIRDITERKKAEEELKKSKERMRETFEASPDPVFILNEDGVCEDINKAASQILGYDKEEIIGSHLRNVPFLPRDSAKIAAEKFEKRKEGKEIPPYKVELKSKDGESILVEVNVGQLEENRRFSGEVVIARDISERVQHRLEKYRKERITGTSENIIGDLIREFEVDISAGSVGLPKSLEHMAHLSTSPPPQNVFDFLVMGIKKNLGGKEIETSEEKIRDILSPYIRDFLKGFFSLSEEYYIDIPSEYRKLCERLKQE